MLGWSVGDGDFDTLSGQTKDYNIDMGCLVEKQAAFKEQELIWLGDVYLLDAV